MARSEAITLGAQVGGEDAYAATNQAVLALRRLLAAQCVGPYSAKFDVCALVLRIDGEVDSWGRRGADRIVLSEHRRRVTADIYIPNIEWKGDGANFREFLAEEVTRTMSAICAKAEAKWPDFEKQRMFEDVARALKTFRAIS